MIIHCCPLAEVCPNKVLPVIIRSGRELANALSIKKYPAPNLGLQSLYVLSKYLHTSVAASSITCNALKGVL
jgi:hypothetical protein